ncbi:hypothetical protein A2U01_0083683, partial [Trifolium medium]|nr:hypothetical protein [Trifolium medium]
TKEEVRRWLNGGMAVVVGLDGGSEVVE